MSNPTHEEAKWLIAHAKETNKVEWLAGWDSGRNYGKLCTEERLIKLLEERKIKVGHSLDKIGAEAREYWQIKCRLLEIDNAIALIKGEK